MTGPEAPIAQPEVTIGQPQQQADDSGNRPTRAQRLPRCYGDISSSNTSADALIDLPTGTGATANDVLATIVETDFSGKFAGLQGKLNDVRMYFIGDEEGNELAEVPEIF